MGQRTATGNVGKVGCRTACCFVCVFVRVFVRERTCQRGRVVGDRCCMGDVDVPSWKGRRGRLSTAKEGRKKTPDAIFGKEKSWWLLDGDGGVVVAYGCC